jgi:hypothetical protein
VPVTIAGDQTQTRNNPSLPKKTAARDLRVAEAYHRAENVPKFFVPTFVTPFMGVSEWLNRANIFTNRHAMSPFCGQSSGLYAPEVG